MNRSCSTYHLCVVHSYLVCLHGIRALRCRSGLVDVHLIVSCSKRVLGFSNPSLCSDRSDLDLFRLPLFRRSFESSVLVDLLVLSRNDAAGAAPTPPEWFFRRRRVSSSEWCTAEWRLPP